MEISGENDLQQLPKSPPRRRRSTFFERRESLVAEPQAQSTSKSTCENSEQYQELKQYYEALLKEKQQWKEEVKRRRNDYHELREQCKIAKSGPSRSEMCYSALTDDDIEFLNQRLNLSKIIESQLALHKSVKITQSFYRKAVELDNVMLKICEDNISNINDYVLDNSTIEAIESN